MKTEQDVKDKLVDLTEKWFKDVGTVSYVLSINKKDAKEIPRHLRAMYFIAKEDPYSHEAYYRCIKRTLDETQRQIELLLYVLDELKEFGNNGNLVEKYLFKYGTEKGYIKDDKK